MIEKHYVFTPSERKLIERVLEDDNVGINHMVLLQGEALPEHHSNSHVYMIVCRGTVSLQLGEQERHSYPAGNIVNIPFKTKMNVSNQHPDALELFVIKSPSPRTMKD